MRDLRGKVAVVTGAGSGIGAAMALAFAREGMHVVVADIVAGNAERIAAEARLAGVRSEAAAIDVASRAAVEDLAERTYAGFGAVHLLCNNAGVVLFSPLLDVAEKDWDWIINVNIKGVVNGVGAFAPRMIAQGGEAHIVNTASMSGMLASGAMPLGAYATTKFAVVGYTEALRQELAPTAVGVSLLCPGSVRTGILDSARYAESAERFRPAAEGAPTPSREGVRRMDPPAVAELVLAGIREQRFYIYTHPESRTGVELRFAEIGQGFDTAEQLVQR